MDFHAYQAQARARTRQLVVLFVAAILLVMLGVNLAGAFVWRLATQGAALPDYFVITNCAIVLFYVLGGAWLEWQRLHEGGASVAHRLGAVSPNPYNRRHQRLRNIGEELAIAAGTPVPELFILDHPAINALTAGHDPAHCAVVVTRGALEQLTRDELVAVLAHEYAHIVNGDVALNTRMTGALYGLYSLNMLGRAMLSGARHTIGRNRPVVLLPLLVLGGLVLTMVGWLGALGGRLMQAGLSRQREFLADAQAVQFTRDRDGLGRALRKIAGQEAQPVESDYGEVVAHLWLESNRRRHGWFDTHPPLMTRIRRVYGRPLPAIRPVAVELDDDSTSAATKPVIETLPWTGPALAMAAQAGARATPVAAPLAARPPLPEDSGSAMPAFAPAEPGAAAEAATETGSEADAKAGAAAFAEPAAADEVDVLIQAVRDLGSNLSRAALLLNVIVAGPLCLDDDPIDASEGTPPDARLQHALLWLEQPQAQWLRVPLVELLSARLRPWPLECRKTLIRYCHDAVLADGRIEKTEWIYFTLVRHRLLPDRRAPRNWSSAVQRRRALAEVFGMAGKLSQQSARRVRDALVTAAEQIGVEQPTATPDESGFSSLTRALDVLCTLPPLRKPLLLKALQSLAPEQGCAEYHAFLVAVAAAIDCPPLEPLAAPVRRQEVAEDIERLASAVHDTALSD